MKKVGVVGLGLIGGSLAKAIGEFTSCEIYGYDVDIDVMKKALQQGTIHYELDKEKLAECELLLIALYPEAVITYLTDNMEYFLNGCVVVDCAGIKKEIADRVTFDLQSRGIVYIGGHPMAGIEFSGYDHSFAGLFRNATMILCKDEYTDETIFSNVSNFFLKLGFARIRETTAKEHDRVIAYTSQMAHVVSSAYIKSDTLPLRYGFSAGSFKDLTRVARLNEEMWTELFFANRERLLAEMNSFIEAMEAYRKALSDEDREFMTKLLRDGRLRKEADESKEENYRKQTVIHPTEEIYE